jgi:hypothetical protein
LAKGAREKGTKRGTTRVADRPASLEDQGIDKHLADRARKAAGMSEAQFGNDVTKAVKNAVASVEGSKEVIKEARLGEPPP